MKRFTTVSGLIAATALTMGAMAGTAQADNNADVQNVTIPVCIDLLQASEFASDGCSVIERSSEDELTVR